MKSHGVNLSDNHQPIVDRFVAACQSDQRVVAAFLGGSYATGTADEHSDLDLGLIIADDDYEAFRAEIESFIRHIGEPAFLEDFDLAYHLFVILPDGTEVDLAIGRASSFENIHVGTYSVLVDKKGLLQNAVFTGAGNTHDDGIEALRRQIHWFWHDFGHFIKAMARGQLWWAHGQLGALRLYCMNLTRLSQNITDTEIGDESYFKIEQAVPAEQLAALNKTYCPLERGTMFEAGLAALRFYKKLAPAMARKYEISYPEALAQSMSDKLERLAAHT